MSATTTPPPRRIVGTHNPTNGDADTLNEELFMFPVPSLEGMKMGIVYVQNGLPHDPKIAMEGAKVQPSGRVIDGAYISVLELAPGGVVPLHYTNTLDYAVLTHGELEYSDHDGKTHKVKQGDVVVQCAVAHSYKNNSNDIARMVVTVMPSKPVQIDGKDLAESKGFYNMSG